MRSTVVVCGALANKPGNGGEAWVRLSWVRGLQQLGFDVWFIEELACQGPDSPDAVAVRWFTTVLQEFHLLDRAALVCGDRVVAGSARLEGAQDVRDLLSGASVVVDISGALQRVDLLRVAPRIADVDLDPGHTQIWLANGVDLGLADHDLFFSVGERVGQASWPLPTGGVRWQPCRQPVLLEDWPVLPAPEDAAFTTVTTWRCPFGPAQWDGREYGSKHHEFRAVRELPGLVPARLELAVAMHEADAGDRSQFVAAGWGIRDASEVAPTPDAFRSYVQSSLGEVSVAQGVYVHARSGWFSDRSVRYLASGRPAIVQDTALADDVPVGDGLLTFTDAKGAAAAIHSVLAAPEHHARAAREVAENNFLAHAVLTDFVDRCEVTS